MKTNLAALELYYLIKELSFLSGSKLDKIYNPSKKELILQLHSREKGKLQLKIDVGKVIYLTNYKEPSENPSEFCLLLRKKLENSRLQKIKMLDFERIISFEFETKEEKFELIIEMFSKGNILLLKDNKILIASEYASFKDRVIKPKAEYIYPKKKYNFLELTLNQLKNLLKETDKENVVKCLALDLGLGGTYAEEACLLSKIDKNKKSNELTEKEQQDLFDALNELKNKKIDSRIVLQDNIIHDIVPFELKIYKNLKQKKFDSFSLALEDYFTKELLLFKKSKYLKEIEKLQELIEKQKKAIEELCILEKQEREKAEKIYLKYEIVKNIIDELREISKKHSWQEIKSKLKGHKLIKEVNPEEKSVVVDL